MGARLAGELQRLDALVNNAGVGSGGRSGTRELSRDGIELRFAVNYLAPFVLTRALLDVLKRSAPARIVNVASAGQQALDFDDLMLEREYSGWLARQAHARGLHVAMTSDFAQVELLAEHFDWAMHYGCIASDGCADLEPFRRLGKPLFDIETEGEAAEVCAQGAALGINVLIKRPQFDAYRVGCQ